MKTGRSRRNKTRRELFGDGHHERLGETERI